MLPLDGSWTIADTYRIEGSLGVGGMGEVYKVRHLELDKLFALKTLNPETLSCEDSWRRFKVEARALARLDHPGIVRVTDYGIDRDTELPYLVMELVEGPSLRQSLRHEASWSIPEALRLLRQIANALDSAHGEGILHRDLKPGNIIIQSSESERIGRLVDFGLARMLWAESQESSSGVGPPRVNKQTTDRIAQAKPEIDMDEATVELSAVDSASEIDVELMDRTQDGQVVGTPKYMAPETCLGHTATQGSDIYALALIAYELICGKTPFEGAPKDVMHAHVYSEPVAPSAIDPELPPELDAPLLHALAKKSEHRPSTAAAFVDELDAAWHHVNERRWLEATRKPRRLALIALGLGAAALSFFSSTNPGPPGLDTLERWSLDARTLLAPSRAPDTRLALALIDDATLDADPDGKRVADYHDTVAHTLEALLDAGLEGVCLDMLLPDFWATDAFVDLILDHPRQIILAVHSDGEDGRVFGAEVLEGPVTIALGADGVRDLLGWATLQLDRDQVPRRMRRAYTDRDGRLLPTLSTRIAEYLGAEPRVVAGEDFFVDYRQDRRQIQTFGWRELETIALSAPERLAGRFLVVSFAVGGLGDQAYPVPLRVNQERHIDGAELQALAASTLTAGNPPTAAPRWLALLPILLGLPLLEGLLRGRRLLVLLPALLFAWLALSGIAWLTFDRVIAVAAPLTALVLAAAIATALGTRLHRLDAQENPK